MTFPDNRSVHLNGDDLIEKFEALQSSGAAVEWTSSLVWLPAQHQPQPLLQVGTQRSTAHQHYISFPSIDFRKFLPSVLRHYITLNYITFFNVT